MGPTGGLRAACLALALGVLVGCGGPAEPRWAPEAEVQRAIYRHDGPPSITLFTMYSARNGSGLHAGLMINGSQRVIFDPAGTFQLPMTPERNDVHYGITPRMLKVYIDYHARETIDVGIQEIEVSPEVAEQALRLVQANGAVPKAWCSRAITNVLSQLPGFEPVPRTFLPKRAANGFRTVGPVRERTVTDDDADDNHGVLLRAESAARNGS